MICIAVHTNHPWPRGHHLPYKKSYALISAGMAPAPAPDRGDDLQKDRVIRVLVSSLEMEHLTLSSRYGLRFCCAAKMHTERRRREPSWSSATVANARYAHPHASSLGLSTTSRLGGMFLKVTSSAPAMRRIRSSGSRVCSTVTFTSSQPPIRRRARSDRSDQFSSSP